MSLEHIKVHIENALDLVDMISDDVEENFIGTQVNSAIKAHATMTVSTLAILGSYLRQVCEGCGHEQQREVQCNAQCLPQSCGHRGSASCAGRERLFPEGAEGEERGMNEKDALLAAVMLLPPKKREELWNELVELGIIREKGAA